MKKLLRFLLVLVLIALVALGGLVGFLTATEFKPAPVETVAVTVSDPAAPPIPAVGELRVLSWNIGYAGLGAGSDFFMDGGKNSRSADNVTVNRYLNGIFNSILAEGAQMVMLQEVDSDSSRTYGIDETTALRFGQTAYALNYSCPFVPIPWPPMGKVNSGLLTMTDFAVDRAERIALPCPFTWPLSTANLKRCLLVNYLPIEGTDKQLVLVNLHLEAYDSGEGKIAQTNQLRDFIQAEYEKGNYVIAGGDFNQTFPGSLTMYPILNFEFWTPGVLEDSILPAGWHFAYDTATPTCRLLNQPYNPSDTINTQYYVIDGFILSPNVEMQSVKTLDLGFENSDHNPVELNVILVG